MGSAGQLVRGALVAWQKGPGSPLGVIYQVDGPRITVRFDGIDEPRIFNARAGVVHRVELAGMVQRVSTGATGLLTTMSTEDPPRWNAVFDGRLVVVQEADLRPYVLDDPQSRMAEGRLGTPRQFSLAVTARRRQLEEENSELVSLGQARVAIKPHQVSVVHRVITNYPHRYLLCDEVGLGKTIEAGMVLKELRARGGADRTLIIAPANLVRQWQFELKTKFNESFSVINTETVKYLKSSQGYDGNPFLSSDSVIVSSGWIVGDEWAKQVAEVNWDLVIVDEAHHARVHVDGGKRSETRLYKTVKSLVAPSAFSKRSALLLTATPMQLHAGELYSLVELLDPALFPTEQHFHRHIGELPGLNRLVHNLQVHGFPLPNGEDDEIVETVAAWLGAEPADVGRRLREGSDEVERICEELSRRHLLSEVLLRNRKKIVGGFMPRVATRWEVELTAKEQHALDSVEEYVREGYARADRMNDAAYGFVMVLFQKMMASSIQALRVSLDRRRARLVDLAEKPIITKRMIRRLDLLEEDLDDDVFVGDLLEELSVANAAEAVELAELVTLLREVPTDSKADTLLARLRELQSLDPAAKVLLFTEFRETQEYLRDRLAELGWAVHLFHGQLRPAAKDASVEEFRNAEGPSILLSTEAGGEGRNFQFCHYLVNYDLPWNPMRVEQRIGRVDRIGQAEAVQIFNFWVKGTVEERVLDVLERRIDVFENTVGGLDPILGEAERDLKAIFRLSGERRDRELQRFEEQLERNLARARQAEEKLRDFIMETRSYSRGIAESLAASATQGDPAADERFVTRLLADANTWIEDQGDGVFHLMFHEPFVGDHPELVKGDLRRRRVTMRPDVKADSEEIEYLASGHPIVDVLVDRVTGDAYSGAAAAFEVEGSPELPPAEGWLLVFELGIPSLRTTHEQRAWYVPDGGAPDEAVGERLVERAGGFPNDRALTPTDVPDDTLPEAVSAASDLAHALLEEREARAKEDAARQLALERSRLDAYFDYRDQTAADRLSSARQVLAGLEASEDQDTRRIIPVWKANVEHAERLGLELGEQRAEQIASLENRAKGMGDLRLAAIARVVIHEEDP